MSSGPSMQPEHDPPIPVIAARRLRRWRDHPTVRFLGVVAVLLGLYTGYGYLSGPSRLTPRLHARLTQHPDAVDILVTANFPPEEFHISIFQELGSMRGVDGSTAALYTVTPANVRVLSRYYWIRKIDLVADTKQTQNG